MRGWRLIVVACAVVSFSRATGLDTSGSERHFTLTKDGQRPSPPTRFPASVTLESQIKASSFFHNNRVTIMDSTTPNATVEAELGHSLVSSIFEAYSNHYNLVLRPDDIWLSIVITLAQYVDNHAEAMRDTFVDHDGREQIFIETEDISPTVDNTARIIGLFSDAIDARTKAGVREWLEPRFSTTTPHDSLIARVALMATMKKYFEYDFGTLCGLPSVTLKGTLDDWHALRTKIQRIAAFGQNVGRDELKDWTRVLTHVLDKFIDSYEGRVDNDWWQQCAVSDPPGSGTHYLSGWVLAFAPFNAYSGSWQLNPVEEILATGDYGNVPLADFKYMATVDVPVFVWKGGVFLYEVVFYAGGLVNIYDAARNELRPSYDFVLFKREYGPTQEKDELAAQRLEGWQKQKAAEEAAWMERLSAEEREQLMQDEP